MHRSLDQILPIFEYTSFAMDMPDVSYSGYSSNKNKMEAAALDLSSRATSVSTHLEGANSTTSLVVNRSFSELEEEKMMEDQLQSLQRQQSFETQRSELAIARRSKMGT